MTAPTETRGAALPALEVVVVSHGAAEMLLRCLRSLRAHPPATAEMRVTVVDSGSTDGTPDRVESEHPEVRLLRRANIGFSAANNLVLDEIISRIAGGGSPPGERRTTVGRAEKGAAAAVSSPAYPSLPAGTGASVAPAVLLLNPDTEMYAGTVDSSLERLRSDPSVGMVGCKLVTEDGRLDHACKRSFPTPVAALGHFAGISGRSRAPRALSRYRASHLGEDQAGEVDAVNGAYMMVRPEALASVGRLDEGYWLYMEDLDWCRRFWDAGWKVFYEPAGIALHVKGGSSPKRRRAKQEIAFHRGMGRFYRRFEAPGAPGPVNLAVYAAIAIKLVVGLTLSSLRRP